MSHARVNGLSAGEAVLGLLIEQPDHRFSLERRLQVRFGSAQFSYSTAYSAVRRLERDGYVQAVGAEQDGQAVVYEATPAGVEHFRAWVRAPTSAPIPREELHAKIALSEPRDLPRLIDVVHAEELACIAQLDRIRERMVAEQRSGAVRPAAEQQWSEVMDVGVVYGEAAFWGGRIAQLGRLRVYVEELREEAERRALQEHQRRQEARRAG